MAYPSVIGMASFVHRIHRPHCSEGRRRMCRDAMTVRATSRNVSETRIGHMYGKSDLKPAASNPRKHARSRQRETRFTVATERSQCLDWKKRKSPFHVGVSNSVSPPMTVACRISVL